MTEEERTILLNEIKIKVLKLCESGDYLNAFFTLLKEFEDHPKFNYSDSLFQLGMHYLLNKDYINFRRWVNGFR